MGYPLSPKRSEIIASPWPKAGRGANKRERVLLFAGRFVKVKNILCLVRAFAAAAGPEWRLELIGDGPEKQNLESRIQNREFRDRVVIRPPLPHTELCERIARVYAFILPSLSDVSPNVNLDCIAVGTPFLLTRETGFYETLKDIGLFVDPRDGKDIAAKLRLLIDPHEYGAYRERIAKFSDVAVGAGVAAEWSALVREVSASGA